MESKEIWRQILSQNTAAADEKKRKIVEAAIHLIAHKGIAAVTFDLLGTQLKTTKANIKYHFNEKEQLIFTATRVVVLNAQRLTMQMVEEVDSPEAKLTAIIEAAYVWLQRFPEHAAVWMLFMYYAHVHEEYARFYEETRAAGQSRLQLLLRALPHEHKHPPAYDRIAETIQNILYGQMTALIARAKDVKANKRMTYELVTELLKAKGFKWHGGR